MPKTLLALMTAAALLMPIAPAGAAVAKPDADDTQGKLDISVIQMAEVYEGQEIIAYELTIGTYDKWRCGYLAPAKDTALKWLFDKSGNKKADWIGRFVCQDGTLVLAISSKDGSQNLEPLPAEHPGQKKVKVTIPGDFFEGVDRLWAKSRDAEAKGCSDPCKDRAPNKGSLI